MADTTRRDFLTTSAAAVAAAATAGRALGQPASQSAAPSGTFFEKGAVRIRYLDTGGTGFPLLIIPGGGLSSTIQGLISSHPFNAIDEFKSEFRCIACDLRTAYAGDSTGPLEIDRPWDSFTDDHVGVLDHLGILVGSWSRELLPLVETVVKERSAPAGPGLDRRTGA
jgi:hypothetical protein